MPVIPAFQCNGRRIKFSRPALVNETLSGGKGKGEKERKKKERRGGMRKYEELNKKAHNTDIQWLFAL